MIQRNFISQFVYTMRPALVVPDSPLTQVNRLLLFRFLCRMKDCNCKASGRKKKQQLLFVCFKKNGGLNTAVFKLEQTEFLLQWTGRLF